MSYLNEKYNKEVVPAMVKKFGYTSRMEAPKIDKIVINCGYGRLIAGKTKDEQKKIQDAITRDIALISGQKAILTKSRLSISTFKIRVRASFSGENAPVVLEYWRTTARLGVG